MEPLDLGNQAPRVFAICGNDPFFNQDYSSFSDSLNSLGPNNLFLASVFLLGMSLMIQAHRALFKNYESNPR